MTTVVLVPPDALRIVPMFADLADDDLAWIAARSEMLELDAGEVFFTPGEPADWMFVALEGTLQARREHLGLNVPAFVARAGDVAGTIPFSRMTTFTGTGRAVTPARLARFPKAMFAEMLRRIPALEQRFVSHLVDRVRDATRRDSQFEKLTALGKLSAGVAHELNNPIAVVLRSIGETRRRLDDHGRMTVALADAGVPASAILRLDALRRRAAGRDEPGASPDAPDPIDALACSDQEDVLAEWLRGVGVPDPWTRAATFAEAGLGEAALADALVDVPPEAHASALCWLEAGLAAQSLVGSAEQASDRIARIVDALKAYTHRDRARDMADVDLREGLESTLALFASRLREKGVALERDYAPALPRVRAYPGDLNQVWSSLLDNAIDAVPAVGGRIAVRTTFDAGAVIAEIRDNGPGIPAELEHRVWEPFFTTKEVGKGTGLGLDIARRIVADLHGGALTLASTPGDTCFTVRLSLTTVGTMGM